MDSQDSQAPQNESKPEVKPSSEHLNLKVVSQDGNEVYFKVKATTQLKKLMDAYCQRVGREPGTMRFFHEGQRIQPSDTPESLDMESEDTIDAMVEQSGGAF